MKIWDVYVDGMWMGTVQETTESNARCAALSKFEVPNDATLSVKAR